MKGLLLVPTSFSAYGERGNYPAEYMKQNTTVEFPFHNGITILCIQERSACWLIRLVSLRGDNLCQTWIEFVQPSRITLSQAKQTATSLEKEQVFTRIAVIHKVSKRRERRQ